MSFAVQQGRAWRGQDQEGMTGMTGAIHAQADSAGIDPGLERVVAAATVLSEVDGEGGRLIIRGHAVEDLARSAAFEDVASLMWAPGFPDLPEPRRLREQLGAARTAAYLGIDGPWRKGGAEHSEKIRTDVVRALRLGWAQLEDDETLEAAVMLAAAAPVLVAGAVRAARGLEPVAPDPSLSAAEDFLRMLRGQRPAPQDVRALDAYLATICDHGLNASTFAARVVASTRAGLVSAAVAGLSALKGPLHGGAPGPVLDMLDAIGTPANAEAWLEAALTRGERLMGFGHRVYRVRDPRADALKIALRGLPGTAGRIAFAEEIEREALSRLARRHPARSLETNVEFYTSLLLEALDIPREAFTAVFAMGRILGWVAHAREQIASGRLVRPRSVYVGPALAAAA
jgi:citrate synthase